MLKSLFSFLKRIDSVSEILYRKSISPEVLFSCQKGENNGNIQAGRTERKKE